MRRAKRLPPWFLLLFLGVWLCPTLPSFADVAPWPFRAPRRPVQPPPTSPTIIWQPVKPFEPVLQVARPASPPMSLTCSDGAGLELVAVEAKAVVEDPLTFTELHLTFRNPEPRVREGQFEILLPPGAAISRFAMRIGSEWQEGEVVELQAARRAYEDFLHRRQDPALLEKQAGNSFRARVFPIPPNGQKELIVSYSAERPRAAEPYRIYLRGLPKLGHLSIRALVAKSLGGGLNSTLGGKTLQHQSVTVEKDNFTPDVDFEVEVPVAVSTDGRSVGIVHQNLLVTRVAPKTVIGNVSAAPLSGLTVLFDTSASRALGFAAQMDLLRDLVAEFGKRGESKTPLRVLAFDQTTDEIFSGSVADVGPGVYERLRLRRALGASDLSQALRFVVKTNRTHHRLLLLGDGVLTAGITNMEALKPLAQDLKTSGFERLDAIMTGGLRDEAFLRSLTQSGFAKAGVVLDGDQPTGYLAARLLRSVRSGIQVTVPGSQWVWPSQLDSIQPGDEVLVYADVPNLQNPQVVLSHPEQQSETFSIAPVEVPRPLLERAWVGARIARLSHQRISLSTRDPDLSDAIRHQIIDLSVKHRVLSDFTALLVLETEADYARFQIDRRALTDILGVGLDGIEVRSRKNTVQVATPPPPPPPPPFWRDRRMQKAGGPPPVPSAAMRRPEMAADAAPSVDQEETGMGASAGAAPGGAASGGEGRNRPSPAPMIKDTARESERDKVSAKPAFEPSPPRPASAPPPPPPPRTAMMSRPDRDDSDRKRAEHPVIRRPAPEVPVNSNSVLRPTSTPKTPFVNPYEGKFAQVMELVKAARLPEALSRAQAWRDSDAGDVLALVALGEVYEARQERRQAARAYGSIIDLFPGRADLRRFAGSRLERLIESLELATDTFAKAALDRPDHPSSHRMLAYALLKQGKPGDAFLAILAGVQRTYPSGRFAGVQRILLEDAELIAAVLLKKAPNRRDEILRTLQGIGASVSNQPSLRFVLSWETDANDVDFHVYDGRGGHAYYSTPNLPTGGELYADVTTGYGPECFTVPLGTARRSYPYKLQAHYYSRGPMGYGMGKLQVIEHDGKGELRFSERPFLIMVDGAFVDLGEVRGPLP